MLAFVPIQQIRIEDIEFGKLYWHNPIKPISPIIYGNEIFKMKQFCILTTFCKVKHIDITTGRIQLDICDMSSFENLILMQSSLLLKVSQQYRDFFPESTFTHEEITKSFQPLVDRGMLTVYIPYGRNDSIQIYERGRGWRQGIQQNGLKTGDSVKIALKIYGIAYQYLQKNRSLYEGEQLRGGSEIKSWSGRCRIQHQVITIYKN